MLKVKKGKGLDEKESWLICCKKTASERVETGTGNITKRGGRNGRQRQKTQDVANGIQNDKRKRLLVEERRIAKKRTKICLIFNTHFLEKILQNAQKRVFFSYESHVDI